ncbi:MFS transporter [Sporomusa termitida]|uniref:Multidrug resistance protein MdtG n=1 Tax=Sporomusa termitida TaxID=2377 RepID=A0A517DYA6_9FIRM|nr:MFS transporter [Sporomusa termitida]QDR82337.1 Multidrug resistance protein MdtG [Sporomusa termitida]
MNWRRNLWTLAFAVMLSGSSYTMVIPFLPLYLLEIGVSPDRVNLWSGFIFSVTFFIAAVMAPYWGRRADQSGRRRMILRAGFSLAAVYLLGAFVRNPADLLAVRVLQGVASGFVPASMAIVAASTPPAKMGFSLGIMQTTLLTGGILGPVIGGTLTHLFGMRLSFVAAAVIIFLGTLMVGALVAEPKHCQVQPESSIRDDLRAAFRNRRLMAVLLLLFAVQAVSMILQPLITLYVVQLQGNAAGVVFTAGIVYSLAGVAGAISAPLWGRLGQRAGFLRILVVAFAGAGLFNLSQFFAGDIYQFAGLQFLYGLFIVGVFPAINTIAVSCSDANSQGRIFGLTTTANQLGSMVGPLLGGGISSWLGIRPVFLVTGGMLLVLGGIVFLAGKTAPARLQSRG